MWFFSWFRRVWQYLLSDADVLERYRRAGAVFGDAVSEIYMGERRGFDKLHAEWARWELEVSRRGFRTFSVDAFRRLGGWARPIPGFGERRSESEKVVLHAEIFRQRWLGKVKPVIDFNAMLNQPGVQIVQYVRPSTEGPEPDVSPDHDPGVD